VASYKNFADLLTGNSSSKIRKNSPIGSTKASASMVGEMFMLAGMSY